MLIFELAKTGPGGVTRGPQRVISTSTQELRLLQQNSIDSDRHFDCFSQSRRAQGTERSWPYLGLYTVLLLNVIASIVTFNNIFAKSAVIVLIYPSCDHKTWDVYNLDNAPQQSTSCTFFYLKTHGVITDHFIVDASYSYIDCGLRRDLTKYIKQPCLIFQFVCQLYKDSHEVSFTRYFVSFVRINK